MPRFDVETHDGFRIAAISAPRSRSTILRIRAYTYIFCDDVHVATIAANEEDPSFDQHFLWVDDDVADDVKEAVQNVCGFEKFQPPPSDELLLWIGMLPGTSLRKLFHNIEDGFIPT